MSLYIFKYCKLFVLHFILHDTLIFYGLIQALVGGLYKNKLSTNLHNIVCYLFVMFFFFFCLVSLHYIQNDSKSVNKTFYTIYPRNKTQRRDEEKLEWKTKEKFSIFLQKTQHGYYFIEIPN